MNTGKINFIQVICSCEEPEPEEIIYTTESYPPYKKTTGASLHSYCKKCNGIIYPKAESEGK